MISKIKNGRNTWMHWSQKNLNNIDFSGGKLVVLIVQISIQPSCNNTSEPMPSFSDSGPLS